MHFDAEHHFVAGPSAVASVLADPAFYETLDLPDLSRPEVVAHERDDATGSARVLLRYEYTGNIDGMARRLIGGDRLTWTQELRLASAASGTLHFEAEANPSLLHGDASFTLEPEGTGTVRRLSGELVVAIPVFGGMAEGRIVPGLLARLDIEAEGLNRRLAQG